MILGFLFEYLNPNGHFRISEKIEALKKGNEENPKKPPLKCKIVNKRRNKMKRVFHCFEIDQKREIENGSVTISLS